MSTALIEGLLIFLLVAVALNLWLTVQLIRLVRPPKRMTLRTLPLDAALPAFSGQYLIDEETFSSPQLIGAASVLLFLSTRCGDCRAKIPRLAELLPAIKEAGVNLLIIAMDPAKDARRLLDDTPLLAHAVLTDNAIRTRLNPNGATPFYIFVDHEGTAQASNIIGDENWRVFEEQMQEILDASEAVTEPVTQS